MFKILTKVNVLHDNGFVHHNLTLKTILLMTDFNYSIEGMEFVRPLEVGIELLVAKKDR